MCWDYSTPVYVLEQPLWHDRMNHPQKRNTIEFFIIISFNERTGREIDSFLIRVSPVFQNLHLLTTPRTNRTTRSYFKTCNVEWYEFKMYDSKITTFFKYWHKPVHHHS